MSNASLDTKLPCVVWHQDKVATDLGFYYMANAMGRLVGVLMGGFLYHYTVTSPRLNPRMCMIFSTVSCSRGCLVASPVVYS